MLDKNEERILGVVGDFVASAFFPNLDDNSLEYKIR